MPRTWNPELAADAPEQWLAFAAETQDIGAGFASSVLAMPAFFIGWVCVGLLAAAVAPHPAEARRQILALGAALGPLMLIVAVEACNRGKAAVALVLEHGVDHGGELDILVLIHDSPGDVQSVVPTLDAVMTDVRALTIARALPYLWLADDVNGVVDEVSSELLAARDLVPIPGAGLAVYVDATPEAAARRFTARSRRPLVLHAIGDTTSMSDRW